MNGKVRISRSLGRGVVLGLLILSCVAWPRLGGQDPSSEKIRDLEARLDNASGKARVEILTELSVEYRSQNVEKAVENGLAAWKLAKKVADKRGEAAALAALSQGYLYASDYAQCEKYARLCLQAYTALSDVKGKALGLNNIGNALFKQERLQEALNYYSRSLMLRRQINDQDGITTSLMNIGLVYSHMNRYRESLSYYKGSERRARKAKEKKKLITILCNMGIAHKYLAQYDVALENFQESLKIAEETGDQYNTMIMQINIGCIHLDLSQYEPALERFAKSLKLLEETGSNKETAANVTYNIGAVYDELRLYGKALDYHRKSLAISRSINDKYSVAFIQLSLGKSLASFGEYEKAETELQQAMQLAQSLGADNLQGEGWLDFGYLYRKLRRFDDAGRAFNEALKKGKTIQDPTLVWRAFYEMGQLREEQGNIAEAVRAYESSIGQIEDVRVQLRSEEFRTSFLQQRISVYEALARLLIRRGNPVDLAAAFAISERARARSFLDLLMLRKLGAPPGKVSMVNPTPLKLNAVQRLLGEDERLVEYLVTDDDVYVFVVGCQAFRVKALGIGRQKLQETIYKLRSPFEAYKKGDLDFAHLHFDLQLARELYQILFAPLEECFRNGEEAKKDLPIRLIIVPDDTLYYLPFEALAVEIKSGSPSTVLFSEYEQATYLLEKYPISYSFSASMLDPQWRRQSGGSRRIIAFGNPAILAKMGLSLLPRTADEVAGIRSLYGDGSCTVRTGEHASESAFKKEVGKYGYIHIATHGVHSAINPLQSRLYFSSGEDGSENGVLTADEIYGMKLYCRLVTLSACETGLGDLKRGEGMLSLARAFLYAGASQVISSLWSVEDNAYPLMIRFYDNLKKGAPPVLALRQAKLAMLVRREKIQDGSAFSGALPYLWAPFILIER